MPKLSRIVYVVAALALLAGLALMVAAIITPIALVGLKRGLGACVLWTIAGVLCNTADALRFKERGQ